MQTSSLGKYVNLDFESSARQRRRDADERIKLDVALINSHGHANVMWLEKRTD
jgi:hypothetical protein